MKKYLKPLFATFFVVLLAITAHAQRQSTVVQLLNGSTSTGRIVPSANDLIGAGAHVWTYCTSATSLVLVAEESPDGNSSHYVQVSPTYGVPVTINGDSCGWIVAGGLMPYPALNVISISGGSISAWYAGTTGVVASFPTAANSAGATTPIQCDKTAILSVSATSGTLGLITGNSNQVIYVCGFVVSFSGTPSTGTVIISSGTGGTCSPANNLVYLNTTASTPQTVPIVGSTSIFKANPGPNMCINNTSTTALVITIYYAQT